MYALNSAPSDSSVSLPQTRSRSAANVAGTKKLASLCSQLSSADVCKGSSEERLTTLPCQKIYGVGFRNWLKE
jgi:hypothetical protein